MLALPAKGFQRSVYQHNVDLAICCDWLEANCLFSDQGDLSGSDVVDFLRENEIYSDQDFAWELITNAFSEVRQRSRHMGAAYPIEVKSGTRFVRRDEWKNFIPYAFCLTLSLPVAFPKWARSFGADFTEQGELFETLTAESVAATMSGWTVHSTGWTRTNPSSLGQVVADVAARLGDATGDLMRWTAAKANEAGLDLLCFRPFPDGRVGVPVYLVQCASGGDWKKKLKTPDLRIWTKAITFASDPKKAFSMPFALDEREFTYNCNIVDGLLLDRHRLMAPGRNDQNWLSEKLSDDIKNWVERRIGSLPLV
jgi:hypothetical protein